MMHFDIHAYALWIYIGMFLLAAGITLFAIPSVIFVSKKKRLLDKPDHRKKHKQVTPNLGGIAIFSAFVFVTCAFNVGNYLNNWGYILASAFLLFVTGLKDDLVTIDAYKKFAAQFIAALIIVFLAGVRLNGLNGFLYVDKLQYIFSFCISLIGIAFVTNAFNLIDGVDGLASSICLLIFSFYGIIFGMNHNYGYAMICFALCGALVGFLRYNINPAKIFMGDTGSLVLGFLVAVLSIAFVNQINNRSSDSFIQYVFGGNGSIAVVLAALIVPVYDTFRVFTIRILKGKSPFHADRTHIHHLLLDNGFTPNQVSLTLFFTTLLFICGAMTMTSLGLNNTISIGIIMAVAMGMVMIVTKIHKRKTLEKRVLREQKEERKLNKLSPEEYINSVLKKAPQEQYEEKALLVKNN